MLSRFADIPGSESRGRDFGRDNLGHNKDKKCGFRVQAQSKRNGPSRLSRASQALTHTSAKRGVSPHRDYPQQIGGFNPPGGDLCHPSVIITRQQRLLRTTQAHRIFCICSHSLTHCEIGMYQKLVVRWSTYSLTLRSEILGIRALIKSCCTTM